MEESQLDIISSLIEDGENFNYDNFSTKTERGYPAAYTPDWLAWQGLVQSTINKLFGEKSAISEMLDKGLKVSVIGNGSDKFEQSKSYFIGALKAAERSSYTNNNAQSGNANSRSRKVFVVHGHDDKAKNDLEIFLNEINLEPVVLHRQADEGQTIIEKFEKHSDVGYAFILLTPDEIAYLKSEEHKDDIDRNKEYRARPNVIFEFGYFVGKLGRSKVCCLYTGDVALPSDIQGMIYKKYQTNIEDVAYSIIKDLKASGYKLS